MTGKKIAVIGGGNMGSAIIGGIIAQGNNPADIILIEPLLPVRKKLEQDLNIFASEKIQALIKNYSVVVIAVKPGVVKEILKNLSPYLTKDHLLLSVAAGISVGYIEKQSLPPTLETLHININTDQTRELDLCTNLPNLTLLTMMLYMPRHMVVVLPNELPALQQLGIDHKIIKNLS